MHRLDIPAAFHEADRKVIEQFGMGGTLAVLSEVAGSANDSIPKVMLPHAVYKNAGSQGIVRGGNPFSQSQAPPAGRKLPVAVRLDHRRLGITRYRAQE